MGKKWVPRPSSNFGVGIIKERFFSAQRGAITDAVEEADAEMEATMGSMSDFKTRLVGKHERLQNAARREV